VLPPAIAFSQHRTIGEIVDAIVHHPHQGVERAERPVSLGVTEEAARQIQVVVIARGNGLCGSVRLG
jgi:hypothetical protein